MKIRNKIARSASFFLLFAFAAASLSIASPILVLNAQGGAFFSRTSLSGLDPAVQTGWDTKIAGVIESRDVFASDGDGRKADENLIAAFSGRLQADFFGFGTSLPQNNGNLYRAWQGVGLSLLAGLRSRSFDLPFGLKGSASLESGGGLRATKYSGTGLVGANPAILGQASLDISVSKNLTLGIALPLEYAWKSGGQAFMFGLGGAVRYR